MNPAGVAIPMNAHYNSPSKEARWNSQLLRSHYAMDRRPSAGRCSPQERRQRVILLRRSSGSRTLDQFIVALMVGPVGFLCRAGGHRPGQRLQSDTYRHITLGPADGFSHRIEGDTLRKFSLFRTEHPAASSATVRPDSGDSGPVQDTLCYLEIHRGRASVPPAASTILSALVPLTTASIHTSPDKGDAHG